MLGRGVDLKGLTHVVNLGPPGSAAEYLHRAGRVGRVGGPPGTVISLARDARDVARLRSYAQTLGFELESWGAPEAVAEEELSSDSERFS